MIQNIEWRQPGKNYDPDLASLETASDFTDQVSVTQAHLAPQTEISSIMRQYGMTGEMPVRRLLAEYGEFDEAMDFQTMLETIREADRAFSHVPADIRGRFDNDAGSFLEWIHAEANHDEAIQLGLLEPPVGYVRPGGAPGAVSSTPSAEVVKAAAVAAADAGAGVVPKPA